MEAMDSGMHCQKEGMFQLRERSPGMHLRKDRNRCLDEKIRYSRDFGPWPEERGEFARTSAMLIGQEAHVMLSGSGS
jgi:hypothetical protein